MSTYGHQNGYPVQPQQSAGAGGQVRGYGMGAGAPYPSGQDAQAGQGAQNVSRETFADHMSQTGQVGHMGQRDQRGQQGYSGQAYQGSAGSQGQQTGYAVGPAAAQPGAASVSMGAAVQSGIGSAQAGTGGTRAGMAGTASQAAMAGAAAPGGMGGAAAQAGIGGTTAQAVMGGTRAGMAEAAQAACPPGYQAVRTVNGIQYVPILKKKRSKAAKIGIAVAIICVLLAALIIYFMMTGGFGGKPRQGTAGQLEGKTAEEIQAELDRVVEEGMFNISISSMVEFADGTSEGDLKIENVPGNHYLMRVFITRDDTGEQIYETDFIEPNFHIQSDKLDVDLPAGTYLCTATFHAYDPETEDEMGTAAAQMTIHVNG